MIGLISASVKEVFSNDASFLLSEEQIRRIEPFFPLPHGILGVDGQRIVAASAIVHVIMLGLI
jgi:putative transposase